MPVPEELLAIMACPACHGHLQDRETVLVCLACGLQYPVRDGIPIMLVEEAFRPDEEAPR